MVYYHTCENYIYVRSYHHLPNIVNTDKNKLKIVQNILKIKNSQKIKQINQYKPKTQYLC